MLGALSSVRAAGRSFSPLPSGWTDIPPLFPQVEPEGQVTLAIKQREWQEVLAAPLPKRLADLRKFKQA